MAMLKKTVELWKSIVPGTCIKLFDNYGYTLHMVLSISKVEQNVEIADLNVDDRYIMESSKIRRKPCYYAKRGVISTPTQILVCSIALTEEKLITLPDVWARAPIGRKRTLSVFTHAKRIAIVSDSEIDPIELEAVNLIRQYLNQDGSKDHRQRHR